MELYRFLILFEIGHIMVGLVLPAREDYHPPHHSIQLGTRHLVHIL